jgi:hypothetical protein
MRIQINYNCTDDKSKQPEQDKEKTNEFFLSYYGNNPKNNKEKGKNK